MSDEELQACGICGASVYPEHVASGKAAVADERLRCPLCLEEYKKTHHTDGPHFVGQHSMRAPGEGDAFEPIQVEDDDDSESSASTQVKAFGGNALAGGGADLDDTQYKRPLLGPGQGATRCRTFHSKLNDGAVAFMNQQICQWVDDNPEISIKSATSTMGVWEGKKADPTLIITVFY
jgi:hypothetical protein